MDGTTPLGPSIPSLPIVFWRPIQPPRRRRVARREMIASAGLAGGIAILATIVAGTTFDWWFLSLGIPGAAIAGAITSRHVPLADFPTIEMFEMAILTILASEAVLIVPISAGAVAAGNVEMLAGVVVGGLLGLLFIGLPMLIIVLPCAAVWALLARELAPETS